LSGRLIVERVNRISLAIFSIMVLLIQACSGMSPYGEGGGDVRTFNHLDGRIASIRGRIAEIQFKVPEYDTSSLPFTNKMAQRIVNKSFLLENSETAVAGEKVKILEIRRDLFKVQFDKTPALKVGDAVSIDIPKKTLAIVDFDVIRGHDKSIGSLSMERLTTAIVESGMFNVVERSKLKSILKELALGSSGLMDTQKVSKLGKLLEADMILTGTFADMGGVWNVNLRLINVSTGLIITAFEEKATFKDIKPEAVRDTSVNLGDFETTASNGWLIGSQKRSDGGTFTVSRDTTTGANGTKSSLRISYKLGKSISIAANNLRNRDWSMYNGVEFYAKADQDVVLNFALLDENRGNPDMRDVWFIQRPITTRWQKYRIDFSELALSQHPIDKKLGGDGVLSLDLIQSFRFTVSQEFNPPESSATFWLDEIRLY
jgi:Curli production assembly/transport component CsgG/Carbohydrate binding domain (family 11)